MILPPPPKMDALLYWINTPQDPTLSSSTKISLLEQSETGQQLQALEDKCKPYLEKLQASKDSWRAAQKAPYPSKAEINQKRSQVQADAWHYKFCIAGNMCPNQCQLYSSCWKYADKALGDNYMKHLAQNQALETICRPEREMIERCMGRIVANCVETSFELDQNDLLDDNNNNVELL